MEIKPPFFYPNPTLGIWGYWYVEVEVEAPENSLFSAVMGALRSHNALIVVHIWPESSPTLCWWGTLSHGSSQAPFVSLITPISV